MEEVSANLKGGFVGACERVAGECRKSFRYEQLLEFAGVRELLLELRVATATLDRIPVEGIDECSEHKCICDCVLMNGYAINDRDGGEQPINHRRMSKSQADDGYVACDDQKLGENSSDSEQPSAGVESFSACQRDANNYERRNPGTA